MLVNTLYRPTEPFYSLKCFLPYLPHPYKRDVNEKHDNDLKNRGNYSSIEENSKESSEENFST